MTMMTILVMKIFIMKSYFQLTVFVGVGNGLIHGHAIHLGKKPVQLKKGLANPNYGLLPFKVF